MTSSRRKWGEEVWGESALNLPLSPSACLSLTYGPVHAARLCLRDLSPFDSGQLADDGQPKDLNAAMFKTERTRPKLLLLHSFTRSVAVITQQHHRQHL